MIQTVKQNQVLEIQFQSEEYDQNPFINVRLDVCVVTPNGNRKVVPAFWKGNQKWAFRFSSYEIGKYVYRTECSRTEDKGLHNVTGTFEIVPYTGVNPVYQHGSLKISPDRRHFIHQDGTPFLWLADTWWKGLCKRLTWEGFQTLCRDRYRKGFNAIQIVCGPYPDEASFDPGLANEGGMPYGDKEYTLLNPEYFHYADRRIQLLVDTGFIPVMVGAWGRPDCNAMDVTGLDGLKRHWRNLIARYGAFHPVWIPGGEVPACSEYGEGKWGELFSYIRKTDPFGSLITCHGGGGKAPDYPAELLTDFIMCGGSHFQPVSETVLCEFNRLYRQDKTMPVLCGETGYEGHMQRHFENVQRQIFWMYLLNGAAGHTYGAAGLHHMGVEGDPGLDPIWDYTTWQQAMNFKGAEQVGMGRNFLLHYPWEKMEPHREWSDPDCYTAGIPGRLVMIYRSNRSVYDWTGPRIKCLEPGSLYHGFYFDPGAGRKFDIGKIMRIPDFPGPSMKQKADCTEIREMLSPDWENVGEFSCPVPNPAGVATEKGQVCGTNMVRILKNIQKRNVLITIEAVSSAEIGIILRFQDLNNYLAAIYSPVKKAVYVLERINGSWERSFFARKIPFHGMTDVPQIGENVTFSARLCGGHAALELTDGVHTYCSPSIEVRDPCSGAAGRIGLWRTEQDDPQVYRRFAYSDVQEEFISDDGREGIYTIRTGEDTAPPVPSPQDWVLILEKED